MNNQGTRYEVRGVRIASLVLLFYLFTFLPLSVSAQRLLTLDSCRALALRNNKQMQVSKVRQDVAYNVRRTARTKYLPHVSALGGYVHTTREVSILNNDQWRQYTIAYEIDPDYPDYNVNAKHADADSILICIKIKL